MAVYDLAPTHFNGISLTATPFDTSAGGYVLFDPLNGPMQAEPMQAVQAVVTGRGSVDVRGQPQPAVWHLLIGLSDFTQAGLDSFRTMFSAQLGLVYLRANDGNGVNFRIACRVIGIDRDSAATFTVKLAVPLPLWEENALQSATLAGMAGASGTLPVTPNGDRRAYPIITVTPNTLKTERAADFHEYMRRAIVNRAPLALNNFPIQLLALDNVDSSGPSFIKDTSDSVQINQVGGVAASGAITIPWDTQVGSGLDAKTGMIIVDTEQMYYTANAGNVLTVPAAGRGIGGTTPAAHADNAVMYRSRALSNGDDFIPWVAGVQQERWFGGYNTTATRMYVNHNDGPRQIVTLYAAATAGSPASGGNLTVVEDISGFPDSGVLLIDSELISYQSRDLVARAFKTIQRGAWESTAASHAVASKVYRASVSGLTILGWNKGSNSTPESALARRPAIQLKSSGRDNDQWRYGNEADDANTVFYDGANPNRSGMFRPSYFVPAADLNVVTPLQLNDSSTIAAWKDADPGAGKLQVGRLELPVPCGILAAASAITYDAQPRNTMRLRMLGVPDDGQEISLLDTFDVKEVAIAAGVLTPAAILRKLILNAVRAATTGFALETGTYAMATNGQSILQKVVLDQDTQLDRFLLKLYRSATNNFTFEVILRDNSGATPNLGLRVWIANKWSGDGTLTDFPSSPLTTSEAWYAFWNDAAPTPIFSAGTYWLEVNVAITSGQLNWMAGSAMDGKNDRAYNTVGALYNYPAVFALVHTNGGPVQADSKRLNQNIVASFDKLILNLNNAAADPQTPYVFSTGFTSLSALTHCNAVLSNSANALTLTIDGWLPLGEPFVIDCDKHTVTWKEGYHLRSMPCMVTPSDPAEWMRLESGVTNTFTWTEAGMVSADLKFEWRGRRV